MSEPKWTAGPWSKTPSYPPGQIVLYSQSALGPGEHQQKDVGRYTPGRTTDPIEFEANADLIAAAPELYDALSWFSQLSPEGFGDEGKATLIKARALLAKARGEQ